MFTTQRIRLRKMTEQDVEVYHSWRNDARVMETTTLKSPSESCRSFQSITKIATQS